MGETEAAFEAESQRVLARLLGGRVEVRDGRGAQGTRDFDLVSPEGIVTEAVEVTSVQLPAARATRSGIDRLRGRSLGLTSAWDLFVHEEADIRSIERRGPGLLNKLDAAGQASFDAQHPPADAHLRSVVRDLGQLGVPRGSLIPDWPSPELIIGSFGSGSLDPSRLTEEVEAQAAKADNRRKLAQAPEGATRHLFVWLHDSNWYVSSLLRDPPGTPPPPLLPPEVDVLWAAVGGGASALICTDLVRSDGGPWETVDPMSGDASTLLVAGSAVGPPDPPGTCSICGTPSCWEVVTVKRTSDVVGAAPTPTRIWSTTCASDPAHTRAFGRHLSAAELSQS